MTNFNSIPIASFRIWFLVLASLLISTPNVCAYWEKPVGCMDRNMPAGMASCECVYAWLNINPSKKFPVGCAEWSEGSCNFVSDCNGYCLFPTISFPVSNVGDYVIPQAW